MCKELADIARGTGPAGAPVPAQPVGQVRAERLRSDPMLDRIGRQHYLPPALREAISHHEILRQISLQLRQAADLLQVGLSCGNRRAEREVHSAEHARHQEDRKSTRLNSSHLGISYAV